MEIIIGLIVIAAAGYFVFFRKKDEPLVVSAPYKVEDTPAPAAEPEAVVVVENAIVPAGTEATMVAPAKKPRATKTASAKPAVKKATPAKKVAAKKPAARTATSKKA